MTPESGGSNWLISIPGYNYSTKTKEHSKYISENIIEKYKTGNRYKKIFKAWNIP